jgi:hypothetical protein
MHSPRAKIAKPLKETALHDIVGVAQVVRSHVTSDEPNYEYSEQYIPGTENYGVLKITRSINTLSINLT